MLDSALAYAMSGGFLMADLGVWTVDGDAPRRVSRSGVGLERNLEDWIANDSSLLADGLTIVGRQVRLDGGPLDLLAIDWQDRWVVIELKRERLYRDALAQALDYASSIAGMDADALEELLRPNLHGFGDAEELSRTVRRQLEGEEGSREVAVLLAGVGIDAGLERIATHLGAYGIPITTVTFDVFEPTQGHRLLIREVTEERTPARSRRPRRTLDDIRQQAAEADVGDEFERLVGLAEASDLVVRSFTHAVSVVPRQNRTRRLIYAAPRGGQIHIAVHPEVFAEFFPGRAAPEIRGDFAGPELQARLDEIEAFLQTLPRADVGADDA